NAGIPEAKASKTDNKIVSTTGKTNSPQQKLTITSISPNNNDNSPVAENGIAMFQVITNIQAKKVSLLFPDGTNLAMLDKGRNNWNVSKSMKGLSGRTKITIIAESTSGETAKQEVFVIVNGWQRDGETLRQKEIIIKARSWKGSSGQSKTGSGWQTDIAGGDGTRMLSAIIIHHEWMRKPAKKTIEQVKKEMKAAFVKSQYKVAQVTALVNRITEVYNSKSIPTTESMVLGYLGIRRQCHEWADFVWGKGETKPLKDIKEVRPGMGYFIHKPNEHAMIITDVLWENGNPIKFRVAEANYGTGWENPRGSVPWERTVRNDRIVDATIGNVGSYE
ncbi:MAG: hypothetical protein Q7J12_02575, partial [Syntrophales bacterium]|nr:hypothetical protein [Syntrophales bacterium]